MRSWEVDRRRSAGPKCFQDASTRSAQNAGSGPPIERPETRNVSHTSRRGDRLPPVSLSPSTGSLLEKASAAPIPGARTYILHRSGVPAGGCGCHRGRLRTRRRQKSRKQRF